MSDTKAAFLPPSPALPSSSLSARLVALDRRWPWAVPGWILLCGPVARMVAIARSGAPWTGMGEAEAMARHWAATGVFGDPFAAGAAASAHLTPTMPLIAGWAIRTFGLEQAGTLLAIVSIGIAAATLLILFAAFGRIGMARGPRLLALGWGALLSGQEALIEDWLRCWEGGLAALLLATTLWLVTGRDGRPAPRGVALGRDLLGTGALIGLGLFTNPGAGLGMAALVALSFVRGQGWRRAVPLLAAIASVALIVLMPWAIRNQQQLGAPILLRANPGLELALAYHPQALSGLHGPRAFQARYAAIHPNASPSIYARMRAAGGEHRYSAALGAEAWRWMVAHPDATLRLTAMHLRQLYLPSPWLWALNAGAPWPATRTVVLTTIAGLGGLIGIGWALMRGRGRWRYAVIAATVPLLPYAIVHPTIRYRYLVAAILIFLATQAAAALISHARAHRRG